MTTSKVWEEAEIGTGPVRFTRVDSEKNFLEDTPEPNKVLPDSKAKLVNRLLEEETRGLVQGLGFGQNVEAEAIFSLLLYLAVFFFAPIDRIDEYCSDDGSKKLLTAVKFLFIDKKYNTK